MECNLAPGSYGVPYNKDGQIVFYCITENQLKQILCHGLSAHGLTPDGGFYGGRNAEVVGSGIAIGKDARVVPSSEGTTLDAIQLGTGTNTAIKTFKIWDWILLKSDGKIHQDRLDPYRVEFDVENDIFKWRYVGTETWYDLMDVSLLTGADGKPFTVNEWGNLIEAKITEIQNTVTTGRYLFVVNPYNLAAGTGDNRADKNLPASIAGDMAGHIIAYDGDEQAWYDFGPWVGLKGDTGDSIELRNNGTYIQYKATSAVSWINLIEVVDLKGDKGDTGDVPIMQKGATYIQYSRDGGVTWLDLIAIDDIQGDPGATGAAGTNGVDGKTPEFRISGTILQWKYTTDIVWINLYDLGAGASITIDETIIPNSTNPVQSRVIQSTFATKAENDLKLNIGDNTSLAGTGTRVGGLTTGGAVTPMSTIAATPLPTKEYGELMFETIILEDKLLYQGTGGGVNSSDTTYATGLTLLENELVGKYLFIDFDDINNMIYGKIESNTTTGILTLTNYLNFTCTSTSVFYIMDSHVINPANNTKYIGGVENTYPIVITIPELSADNVGNSCEIYVPYTFNNIMCLIDDVVNDMYFNNFESVKFNFINFTDGTIIAMPVGFTMGNRKILDIRFSDYIINTTVTNQIFPLSTLTSTIMDLTSNQSDIVIYNNKLYYGNKAPAFSKVSVYFISFEIVNTTSNTATGIIKILDDGNTVKEDFNFNLTANSRIEFLKTVTIKDNFCPVLYLTVTSDNPITIKDIHIIQDSI